MSKPQKLQNSTKRVPYIDFKPCEIKKHSDDNWLLVFYWKPPNSNKKWQRFRRRIKYMANTKEREKYARLKKQHIDDLLENNWSPISGKTENTEMLVDVLENYLEHSKLRFKKEKLRYDTLRTHESFINNILKYMQESKQMDLGVESFTKKFINGFINHKELVDEVSERTINNYLSFLFTLGEYMVDEEIITYNVVSEISSRKIKNKKFRQRIPTDIRKQIFSFLKHNKYGLYVISLLTYACFLRRTEITKLRIRDLDLYRSVIYVPGAISKNRKDGFVTLPDQLSVILADHCCYAKPDDFMFSDDNFEPGQKQMPPRKISNHWYMMREKLKLPKIYQFYSLKDTGITENLDRGLPPIFVRDQARHENISTTEMYATKKEIANQTIKNIDLDL